MPKDRSQKTPPCRPGKEDAELKMLRPLKLAWKWRRFLVTAIITAVAIFFIYHAEKYSNSTGFCVSCHAMSYPAEEARRGAHFGTIGMDPGCSNCHMPPGLVHRSWVHMTKGMKDLYSAAVNDFSTQEAYDSHRDRLRKQVITDLRNWDGSTCRACHKNPRPKTNFGQMAHKALQAGEKTCIDCHRGIFHVRDIGKEGE